MLDRLIAQKLPALSKHLADTGTDLVAITPQWFLSLFSQDLPSEVPFSPLTPLLRPAWGNGRACMNCTPRRGRVIARIAAAVGPSRILCL